MIKNQAIRSRSNKALIFIGLFLGVVSAALVVVYLSSADGGGGEVSGGAVTPVVVASKAIPAGTRITEEMIALKPLSSNAVLAGAFLDTAIVVGQVTKVALVAGEQVIPTKVTATGAAIAEVENPPLSYVIPEGKRAVSIEVSTAISASGLVRPGDYVDVILTVKTEGQEDTDGATTARTRDQYARTILQNVQVLSIDQNVVRTVVDDEGATTSLSDGSEVDAEATSVTLAVSPVHGEVLTVAESCGRNFGGRLALALRGFGDSAQFEARSVWAEDGAPPTCAEILGVPGLQ